MRKVFTIGETVYDIIFKNLKPVEAKAGGALLNTSISLGRLKIPVSLIGDVASDPVGKIIESFLVENGVSTDYLTRYDDAQSRIALAFLDEANNPVYSFYKKKKKGKIYLNFPSEISENDIVMFGSFYAIKEDVRNELLDFLHLARKKGAIIVYDPNFRKAHLDILPQVKPFIEENIALAHIVKGSDEDFENIFEMTNSDEIYSHISSYSKAHFIFTKNKDGVWLNTYNFKRFYPVNEVVPVSAVGAGDTFNAGIVYSLLKNGIKHENLKNISIEQWNDMIYNSINFSREVCMSYENYLPTEFASNFYILNKCLCAD